MQVVEKLKIPKIVVRRSFLANESTIRIDGVDVGTVRRHRAALGHAAWFGFSAAPDYQPEFSNELEVHPSIEEVRHSALKKYLAKIGEMKSLAVFPDPKFVFDAKRVVKSSHPAAKVKKFCDHFTLINFSGFNVVAVTEDLLWTTAAQNITNPHPIMVLAGMKP